MVNRNGLTNNRHEQHASAVQMRREGRLAATWDHTTPEQLPIAYNLFENPSVIAQPQDPHIEYASLDDDGFVHTEYSNGAPVSVFAERSPRPYDAPGTFFLGGKGNLPPQMATIEDLFRTLERLDGLEMDLALLKDGIIPYSHDAQLSGYGFDLASRSTINGNAGRYGTAGGQEYWEEVMTAQGKHSSSISIEQGVDNHILGILAKRSEANPNNRHVN